MRGKQGVPEKKHTLAAIVPLTIPQGTGESRRMEYLPALLAYISKISTLTYKKTGLREASQQGGFFFFQKKKRKLESKSAGVFVNFALANFRTTAIFGNYFSCFGTAPLFCILVCIIGRFFSFPFAPRFRLVQRFTWNRHLVISFVISWRGGCDSGWGLIVLRHHGMEDRPPP